VITIQQDDLAFGRSVEVALGGREYAVRVESTDTAATVASRLAGLIAQDYPNNTSANDSRELPAATRVTVLNNQITLQEPAKQGIDDISVTVRNIANPGVITLTAQANTGLIGKSQSLAIGEIASGGSKTFHFDDFGISFALKNSRLVSANEESFSAYVSPITTLAVGTLRQAATVQLGAGATSREQTVISGFKDVRINGENRNVGSEKVSFDNLSAAVKSIQATTEEALSAANFGTVENFIQAVIDRVSAYRTGLGAQQSRLESSIAGLENVSENLLEMNSRIMNSDQAADMARLTRIQIGQKAASAMLAQGNVLPGVILSMLKPQAAIRAGASPL
jgi:flagellin-like hook-associated protein FlgL